MATTRPIVRANIVRSMVKSITGDDDAVSRNLTTLDSAFAKHYTISTWTAAGVFDVQLKFQASATTNITILSGPVLDVDELGIDVNSGFLRAFAAGASAITLALPNDGALHSGRLRRDAGGTAYLSIDGGTEVTQNWTAAGSLKIGNIGRRNSLGRYWDGIISDVSLTEAGGDNRLYAIDEDWISSFDLIDSVGSQNGTAVNITSADSDPYLFNGTASPNTWTNQNPPFNVIEVAGT